MARVKSVGISETLISLASNAEFEEMAPTIGMVRRRRNVDPAAMLWTVVLGLAGGEERSLASMRRSYQKASRTSRVPTAFYDRFTPELIRFLRAVLDTVMPRVEQTTPRDEGSCRGSPTCWSRTLSW